MKVKNPSFIKYAQPEKSKGGDKASKGDGKNKMTTMALGEEGGAGHATTKAVGEEGGSGKPTKPTKPGSGATTKAIGEEGGSGKPGGPTMTTMAIGEEGGSKPGTGATTRAIGEEGGSGKPTATSAAVGEEGGGHMTTLAIGEEGGSSFHNLNWSVTASTDAPGVSVKAKVLKGGGAEIDISRAVILAKKTGTLKVELNGVKYSVKVGKSAGAMQIAEALQTALIAKLKGSANVTVANTTKKGLMGSASASVMITPAKHPPFIMG